MTNYKLIGISGRKRHGKDTLGDYLVQNYGYTKIGFADALKNACKAIFGFNEEQLYGDLKEVDDKFWKTRPRKVLQYVGTDLFRDRISEVLPEVQQDIWIKVVENQILQNPDKRYVITDVRFDNELEFIKRLNGLSIKVQRTTNNKSACAKDEHSSESYIDSLETDCVINNNGTLKQLYEKLENTLAYKQFCKYDKISDFSGIKLLDNDNNTLYVFDIDETLMIYDGIDRNWWKKRINETNNDEESVLDEWLNHINNNEPKHTHESSFKSLLDKIHKINVICLTARKECLKDVTEQHLAQIGIVDLPIYYSNGNCKGKVLKEIVVTSYPTIRNIVFVDDNKNNITSVNKVLSNNNIKVHCYYFKHNCIV